MDRRQRQNAPRRNGLAGQHDRGAYERHHRTQSRRTPDRQAAEEAGQRERLGNDKQDQLIQAAKLVSLGEMATGVAHEINNPLNNICLFAGNILDGLEHGADVTAEGLTGNLKRILQQVKRAAAIVNHLRTFARASSPGHEQVAIDTIVSAAYALMEEQLRLAGIQVMMDLAPGDPQVQGNSIHLEQVFVNLFGNARRACDRAR